MKLWKFKRSKIRNRKQRSKAIKTHTAQQCYKLYKQGINTK